MPQTYSIPIETLTPIWTGDNNMKTSYLRATSFLGGLRFWTEALLRSFGHKVCDVTSGGCIYDPENDIKACPGCQVFGCTGLSRSFQMQVFYNKTVDKQNTFIYYRKKNGNYDKLRIKGLEGQFSLKLTPLRPNLSNNYPLDISSALMGLIFILQWGSLGSKDQYGLGLIKSNINDSYKEKAIASIQSVEKHNKQNNTDIFFEDLFFFQGDHDYNSNLLHEKAYHFRANVRRQFSSNKKLRHYFCGSLDDKIATNYNFALVKNKIFGWGYYPQNSPFGSSRDTCLNALHTKLGEHFSNVYWKEFASYRDNSGSPKNFHDYLTDMIKNPWTR